LPLEHSREAYNDLISMRVLVTGGTGYLGAAIVRALHARGHVPVVFARRATAAALPGVACDGDVRDRQALLVAADGVDAIVHAAALVSIWRPDPREFDAVNVEGLQNVIDVAAACGVGRMVYVSSFMALPPAGERHPIQANDYQRTKVRGLEVARSAVSGGAPLVITFPGVVYGPGAATEGNLVGRLVRDHLRGTLPGIVGAHNPWSFAYVDDVAQSHVAAVERPGVRGEFVLGGDNVPQRRIFELIRQRTGRLPPRRIPWALAATAAAGYEFAAKCTGRPPLLTRGVVKIFRNDWSLNSSRSVAELSHRIRPLDEGILAVLDTEIRG
jgi:nucleoside-diphosphate-sugar epimerase